MSEPLFDKSSTTGVPLLDLEELRANFLARGLSDTDLDPNPIQQFNKWYNLILASQVRLPDAMTLATATPDGVPSARMVLLKGVDERGFVFFTNYQSRKGRELAANPVAALILYWKELDRQVRVEGRVELVSAAESDAYFESRPWGSRIGATVSPQSSVIPGRAKLESMFRELELAHPDHRLSRPEHWGGYRVIPSVIEFWQGRLNRLHDRFRYARAQDGGWRIERLAP